MPLCPNCEYLNDYQPTFSPPDALTVILAVIMFFIMLVMIFVSVAGAMILFSFVLFGCVISGAIIVIEDKINYKNVVRWRKCTRCGNLYRTIVRRKKSINDRINL